MKLKPVLSYLWKLPLCGLAFFIGMAGTGIALPLLGFGTPQMPAGTDANTLALWFMAGSMLVAFVLSFISGSLRTPFILRWLILAELIWTLGVVGMVIESFFFMTTGAVSSLSNAVFTLLNFLVPSLFLSGLVAALFRPAPERAVPFVRNLREYFSMHGSSTWLWRILAAVLAYPFLYFSFGLLVHPFIQGYYAAGQFELTTPTWGQLIPLQLIRSLMFLVVTLPVIIGWSGSRRSLWVWLGLTIFVLTAFMAVITSYWFPWQMRLFHGMELLADGLVYAGVLVGLFGQDPVDGRARTGITLLPINPKTNQQRNRIWNR